MLDTAYLLGKRSSTKYRVPADYDRQERLVAFDVALGPNFPNGGLMSITEGDLLHVTLAGRFGNYPPRDEAGFLAFAKSLHTPKLYDLISTTLSEPVNL
jgi:hypothetical protein